MKIVSSDDMDFSGLMVSLAIDTSVLEQLFRHKVLKMLRSKGKITQGMIVLLD